MLATSRRLAVWAISASALVLGPLAMVTIINPAVSSACDQPAVWDTYSNSCITPAPPASPSGPGPIMMCMGAPVPYDPMGWCYPFGS
ncbi:MAG TPA: hypothetical protein VFB19_16560 [Mycobacterium sp.]|nr:hypothetical protein [Mycobacterium sp.]